MDGPMTYADREEMYNRLFPRHGIGAEVGVKRADNAKQLWARCEPKVFHLIDAWAPQPDLPSAGTMIDGHPGWNMLAVIMWCNGLVGRRRVILHQGFSRDILPLFPTAYFDWVYIDADHRYEAVYADLVYSGRIVKPTGIIAGHDFLRPDEHEMARTGKWGVVQAVEQFCAESGWQLVAQTFQREQGTDSQKYPSFALKRQ